MNRRPRFDSFSFIHMPYNTSRNKPTWADTVTRALKNLGGVAHFNVLNPEVEKLRAEAGIPLSKTWQCTVRRECQKSKFITQDVKRSGVWHLVK